MTFLGRCAVLVILSTLGCIPVRLSAPASNAPGTSCEYIGARFVPPTGWAVKEESDGEPISRITLSGWSGSHEILASFFAREVMPSAPRTPTEQARAYFQKFRAATANQPWTDFIETSFEDRSHTYPALGYRERVPGAVSALDTQQDNIVRSTDVSE